MADGMIKSADSIMICSQGQRASSDKISLDYLQSDAMGDLIRERVGCNPVAFVCPKSDQIAEEELRMELGCQLLQTEDLAVLRKGGIRRRVSSKLAELGMLGMETFVVSAQDASRLEGTAAIPLTPDTFQELENTELPLLRGWISAQLPRQVGEWQLARLEGAAGGASGGGSRRGSLRGREPMAEPTFYMCRT